MEKNWQYLSNQFVNVTKSNFKKAVIISRYHDSVLAAATTQPMPDPDMVMLYNRYHPLNESLITAYNSWRAQGGMQQGSTLSLDQLLGLLPEKIFNWQARLGIIYAQGSAQYRALFPNGRTPFNKGSKDQRINAVDSLAIALGTDPALATLKVDVLAFYTLLLTARQNQIGNIANTRNDSTQLEQVVLAAMKMQYRNLGFLIDKIDNTEVIANLFDVATIRERDQTEFTGTLDPQENEAVLTHTFMADDTLRLRSNGTADIKFYLATAPNGTGGNGITVLANQELTVTASDFALTDYHTHRYLTAVNQSATDSTHYLVELY